MSFLRAASRAMLASYFVVNGVRALRDPDALVDDAEPVAQAGVDLVQRVAPPAVAGYFPESTRAWVRINGAMQAVGGVALAMGWFRRGGAALAAASMLPHVVASRPAPDADPETKRADRSKLLRNVALMGAALLAAQDTEGRPSIAWRASEGAKRLERAANRQKRSMGKGADARRARRRGHAKETD